MTVRTGQELKDTWHTRDPYEEFVDLVDSISGVADNANGSHIWVSPAGNDASGDGSLLQPYRTIGKGLGDVSALKPNIVVLPGTYQENVTWPSRNGVRLMGVGKLGAATLEDASAGGTAVLKIKPGTAFGAQFHARIDNITIDHNGTGLRVDNATADAGYAIHLKNVAFVRSGGTSISTLHGGNGTADAIGLIVEGSGEQIAGSVYLDITNQGDYARFRDVRLSGGVASSAGSAFSGGSAEITFDSCEILHEGVTGGSSGQLVNAIFCHSKLAGTATYALLDTADLAGSHAENIIGS